MFLVVNKTPQDFDFAEIKGRVESTFKAQVAAVLPHSDEMMKLASTGIFALRYPNHPMTDTLKEIATNLVG